MGRSSFRTSSCRPFGWSHRTWCPGCHRPRPRWNHTPAFPWDFAGRRHVRRSHTRATTTTTTRVSPSYIRCIATCFLPCARDVRFAILSTSVDVPGTRNPTFRNHRTQSSGARVVEGRNRCRKLSQTTKFRTEISIASRRSR